MKHITKICWVAVLSGLMATTVAANVCGWHKFQPFMNGFEYSETVAEKSRESTRFTCPVCGQRVTASNWPTSQTLRESGRCPVCASTNRQRQLAYAVNRFMSSKLRTPVNRLGLACQHNVTILNLESSGPIHDALSSGDCNYMSSEFLGPDVTPGAIVDGIRNENVQRLSFQDDTFDLIISTEVFEHVPHPYQGHTELYRVLKPGGAHIFTVPFIPSNLEDLKYASVDNHGRIVHHLSPLYHHDKLRPEGVLVYNVFGQSMVDDLCALGFHVDVLYLQSQSVGIIGSGAIVFEARKPVPHTLRSKKQLNRPRMSKNIHKIKLI